MPVPTDGVDDAMTRVAQYHYVVDSLIGGMEYEGVVKWMARWPTLKECERQRDCVMG
jgi:hypothetical protein